MNSHAEPRNVLVPLAYATLIVAPADRPYSALMLLVTTLNSPTASGDGCITWFEKPWFDVPYALLSTPSIRKLLNVERRPLTLNDPSRGVKPPVLSADNRTPGDSSASAEYSRPLSGNALVCSPVITWLRSLESVCSSTALALTSTFSVNWPTAIFRSMRWRAPTVTCTLSTS